VGATGGTMMARHVLAGGREIGDGGSDECCAAAEGRTGNRDNGRDGGGVSATES
jgi:hypothetical protein